MSLTKAHAIASVTESYTQELFGSNNLTLINATQKKLCEDRIVEVAYQDLSYSSVNYTCTITNQKIEVLNRLRRKLNTNTNTRRLTVSYDLKTVSPNSIVAALANTGVVVMMNTLTTEIKNFMSSIDILATETGPIKALTSSQPSSNEPSSSPTSKTPISPDPKMDSFPSKQPSSTNDPTIATPSSRPRKKAKKRNLTKRYKLNPTKKPKPFKHNPTKKPKFLSSIAQKKVNLVFRNNIKLCTPRKGFIANKSAMIKVQLRRKKE